MKKRSLFSSLAFRVFSVSAAFIIIPLIFYTLLVFTRNYHIRLDELFEELAFEKDELINRIETHEKYNRNFLQIINKALITKTLTQESLAFLYREYVQVEEITASFYLEVMPNGDLICKYSTLPAYEGVNFKPYFADSLGNTFIAADPVYKNSLYMTIDVKDDNGKQIGILVSSLALDALVKKLLAIPLEIPIDIAIMDHWKTIDISTTLPSLVGKKINLIAITENKFTFKLDHEKRYAIFTLIPNTRSFLFLSLPESVLYSRLYTDIWHVGIFLIFIVIFGGTASLILTRRMAKPLKELSVVMSKVGEGNLEYRYKQDRMGFEINILGERFNDMVISLIEYIEEAKRERAAKESYAKELEIGHEIQNSILPGKEVSFPGIELEVFFKPAKEVAGDYYDWVIQDKKILMVIADGVGKSVSGALYAFGLRSILRSFATMEKDISKMVIRTNALFCKDTKESGAFVTAFVASYDSETKILSSINCGHNYPVIKRKDDRIERLELKGIALGVEPFESVEEKDVQLESGEFVILYTDGVTEAQNNKKELFGEKRLFELILRSQADNPKTLIAEIQNVISNFVGAAEQYDDMTLIVFKVIQ